MAPTAAAIVAPQLPAVEVLPLTPPLSPFWSSTLPPATGVLTLEMLQKCIDDISNSIGVHRPLMFPPWYVKMISRLELEDSVARAQSGEEADANDQDPTLGDA